MKDLIILILLMMVVLGVLFFERAAQGQEMVVGVGMMDGHSDTQGRCINPGYYATTEYNRTALSFFDDRLKLKAGAKLIFSRYEAASREFVGAVEYNQDQESSISISSILKPEYSLGRFSVFGILGIGPDWMETDGLDFGYLGEAGCSIRLTDSLSIGISKGKYRRLDTGNYSYLTILTMLRF